MDITKEEPLTTTYKDVEIKAYPKKHDALTDQAFVEFKVNDTRYTNKLLIDKGYTEDEFGENAGKLLPWAKTIIDDNK